MPHFHDPSSALVSTRRLTIPLRCCTTYGHEYSPVERLAPWHTFAPIRFALPRDHAAQPCDAISTPPGSHASRPDRWHRAARDCTVLVHLLFLPGGKRVPPRA